VFKETQLKRNNVSPLDNGKNIKNVFTLCIVLIYILLNNKVLFYIILNSRFYIQKPTGINSKSKVTFFKIVMV